MKGQKILVTGPTGMVAGSVARALADDNDVWGMARFSDESKRSDLEGAGVTCVTVDLDGGDFSALPQDFDYVLNFAVAKPDDFDSALRSNAESPVLLMNHCRNAKAFWHTSSTGVYEADGHTVFSEDSPLGDNHRAMMPTYSISKIAAEASVRAAARLLELPTIIARLNTPYGGRIGGFPFIHLMMMRSGARIPVHTNAPSRYTLFHEEDIVRTLPLLIEAASVPATVINWCGQEHVSIEEWSAYLGELVGIEPEFHSTPDTLESVMSSNAKMQRLAGPARVEWKDGLRRMLELLHPDWIRA